MIFTLWTHLLSWLLQLIPNENWVYRLPPALFNLSLTASIVILAVLLVRLLLRKAPRVYSYALWAVVAFRLICPVSFASDFSLLGILDAPTTETGQMEYIPVNIVHNPHPSVDLIIPEVTDAVNEQLPTSWEQSADPLEWPASLATHIWITGVGIMLLWALISFFSLRHKLHAAVLLDGNVFQSEHVGSPFILGLFRPKIYIPFGLDENTLRYVLAHEKYHIKRLDHIVKVFSFILLTIHWFNPLCWLAFYLMSKDMEMSCDEKVLSQDNNVKTEYSTVLLSFAANRRFPSPSPLAFGETSAKSRIKNALKWKRPKVWVTVLAAVVCVAILVACAANPKKKVSVPEGSPYEWTSTVKIKDIGAVSIQLSSTSDSTLAEFSSDDVSKLVTILNQIPSESIYVGRGIPRQLTIKLVLGEETVTLGYGGDLVEISYPGLNSTDGIWEIHDDSLNQFMADLLTHVQEVYAEYIVNPTVTWEYAPALSSRYPAFPFQFDFPYTHIEATCTAGTLIGYDDHDGSNYPMGTTLTVPSGSNLYWLPAAEGRDGLSQASITFIAYDGTIPTFSGMLHISKLDIAHKSDFVRAVYGAELSSGSLLMYQNPISYGGMIYSVSNAATGASDLPDGTFIQDASLSKVRTSALDRRFQEDVVPNDFSCHSHELLTSHTSSDNGQNTLAEYLLVYYAEYACSGTTISLLHEETAPVILIYGIDSDGTYTLLDYRELTDEEVKKQFPLAFVDEALDRERKNQVMAPACYEAALEFSRSLTGNASIRVHDLTEYGPITLTAAQLPFYRFRTNSEKILLDFERSDEPIVIQLHAVDSDSPILYFSSATSDIASCTFSNLTAAREYYLSVDCADDTTFTISDGGGAFRVFPLT